MKTESLSEQFSNNSDADNSNTGGLAVDGTESGEVIRARQRNSRRTALHQKQKSELASVRNFYAHPFDKNQQAFDPSAPELITSWSSFAQDIYCVNAYPNGVTVSVHENQTAFEGDEIPRKYSPSQFHLRVRDTRDYQLPQGKYYIYKENFKKGLETHLSHLHRDGKLATSVVYFGTTIDPFLSLNKKFAVTHGCLEILEHYRPGLVVIQTRSPMVISGLPLVKSLGGQAVVVMPIETSRDPVVAKYTPGQPRITERIVAARGLRRQGIKVNLCVSPVLPYGNYYQDAWDFAELLTENADYITFGSLASGAEGEEQQLKSLPIACRLAANKNFPWLRPHAYRYLYHAVKQIAPEKLMLPVKPISDPQQLDLFAA